MKESGRFHPAFLALHGLVIVAGLAVLVSSPLETRSLPILGQASPVTVRAASRVTFVDTVATNRRNQQVMATVAPVYRSNLAQAQQSRQQALLLFQNIQAVLQRPGLTGAARDSAIRQLLKASGIAVRGLPHLSAAEWRSTRYWSMRLLNASLEVRGFVATDILHIELSLYQTLPPRLAPPVHRMVTTVLDQFLTPTLTPDVAATQKRQQAAVAHLKPVTVTLLPGTVIVRRGQVVTPAILEELRAVGSPAQTADWGQRTGSVLFALIVITLVLWYLRSFYRDVTANHKLMVLLDAIILATVLVARLMVPGHVLLPYFFPAAAGSVLAALLISSEVGVSLAVVLAMLVGWVVGGSFELTCFYLLTGVTGALAVRHLRRLNDFILAGLYVAVAAAGVIAAFQLLAGTYDGTSLRNYAAASLANGFVTGALAFGGFVVLGNAFGVTTTLHLLELGHPDQRLLRRLMAEAPGTYNHSLVVASMVERAAGDIDSNGLLARVMALYHDIGKITNPLCFIENQMAGANIHDDLRPEESAEIIRSHVTHGATLVKQAHLPAIIGDAVLQHHGTMTMPYFFHRALEQDANADAQVYRYPGPLPQTKECGLLMLADGCEAAVRGSTVRSPQTIHETVNRIIDERVAGGQLSECQLTLRDLEAARAAFVAVLNGIYHPRIEYPVTPTITTAREPHVES